MGFLKRLFGKGDERSDHVEVVDKGDKQDVMGYVSDIPGKGLSLEDAQRAQAQAMEALEATDSVDQQINVAAQLLTSGNFQGAIDAYQAIAKAHPAEAGTCEGQIGAAQYFLGDYKKAIEHYKKAKALGADAAMMDFNIEEAEEALAS